jgi:peroxiredoxin Q/BCP
MKTMLVVFVLTAACVASRDVQLAPGDVAPDFTRPSTTGRDVKLSDFRGKQVVLAFFIRAGTPG